MVWQDIVFAVGGILFYLSLLPSVFSPHKPNALTSIPTATVLYLFTYAYITMGFYFAAGTTALTATTWLQLFLQRLERDRNEQS